MQQMHMGLPYQQQQVMPVQEMPNVAYVQH